MGLFIKKEDILPLRQLYTFSDMEKKKLVVGLGNPGHEYSLTRHNAGFMAVEHIADKLDIGFVTKKDLSSLVAIGHIGNVQVILAKPTTFMNESGRAVQALMNFYKVSLQDTLVIHDELDLNFGDLRLKNGGGTAGHNGLKSIVKHLGEDFVRIRIGIGPRYPEEIEGADFVLQNFSKPEQRKLSKIAEEAERLTQEFLDS